MGSQQVRLCVLLAIIPATGACGRDPDKVGGEPTLKIDPSVTLKDDLSGSPSRVVFSPDGRLLAVGQVDGTVTLFDARTWARGAVFKMEPHMVTVLAFSRDGRWLAASSGFTAHVWGVQDREEFASLDHDRVYVTSAAFSADGKELITTTRSNAGWLWAWHLGSKAGAGAF